MSLFLQKVLLVIFALISLNVFLSIKALSETSNLYQGDYFYKSMYNKLKKRMTSLDPNIKVIGLEGEIDGDIEIGDYLEVTEAQKADVSIVTMSALRIKGSVNSTLFFILPIL